jgi:hypothetical protein
MDKKFLITFILVALMSVLGTVGFVMNFIKPSNTMFKTYVAQNGVSDNQTFALYPSFITGVPTFQWKDNTGTLHYFSPWTTSGAGGGATYTINNTPVYGTNAQS